MLKNNQAEIYKLKNTIEAEQYNNLGQNITDEKWTEMLAELRKNTALDITELYTV